MCVIVCSACTVHVRIHMYVHVQACVRFSNIWLFIRRFVNVTSQAATSRSPEHSQQPPLLTSGYHVDGLRHWGVS